MRAPTSSRGSRARLADVVTPPDRAEAYRRSGAWDGTTLSATVAAHAATAPDDVAVVDLLGERRLTYGQLAADAARVTGFLRDAGIAPGDVVAVQMPNRYETVAVALGILGAGAVINPMLPVYREKELRHMLAVGQTGVMFLPDAYRGHDHLGMLAGISPSLPALHTRVVIPVEGGGSTPPAGFTPFARVLDRDPDPAPPEPDAAMVSELIFTSGTEAAPKAIMHTEQTANAGVRALHSSLGMTPRDVVWMPSPIGHSTGFNFGVRMALLTGLTLVLQDRWDAVEAARLVEGERCTYTLAATTFLHGLVEAAGTGAGDVSSLRLFGCGGAPVPPDLVRSAVDRGIGVLRLYGSTEALVVTQNRPSSPLDLRVNTDGRPLDGVEVEIRDEAGDAVIGEPGEIVVRGPETCVGFFDDLERTSRTFEPGGWVRSGDLGVIDAQGYLTVVGRKKEIIIRGGLNIAPREIEDLVVQIRGVRAAAVVGLPHDRLGEIGCVCVVMEPGATLSLEDVTGHLHASGLARYKHPERLEVVSEIPATATGKIQKFKLVEQILAAGRPS